MLDSLVRVSRRVGWKADKFTTDPERKTPACPTSRRGAVGGHGCPVPASRTPPESREAAKANAVVPRSQSGWPHGAITARAETHAYLPRGLLAAPKPVVALCPWKVHTAEPGEATRSSHEDPEPRTPQAARRAEFHGLTLRIHPFTSERFHVLLNSLFKVLFNFPSRYLSAIGLVPVFSLRWSLPPTLGCIPKQPDS